MKGGHKKYRSSVGNKNETWKIGKCCQRKSKSYSRTKLQIAQKACLKLKRVQLELKILNKSFKRFKSSSMTTNINEASLTELDKMKEAIDNLETAMKKVPYTLNVEII